MGFERAGGQVGGQASRNLGRKTLAFSFFLKSCQSVSVITRSRLLTKRSCGPVLLTTADCLHNHWDARFSTCRNNLLTENQGPFVAREHFGNREELQAIFHQSLLNMQVPWSLCVFCVCVFVRVKVCRLNIGSCHRCPTCSQCSCAGQQFSVLSHVLLLR